MTPNYLLGFLWGIALTLILFLIFINKGIENTKVKVDRAYVQGATDCLRNKNATIYNSK